MRPRARHSSISPSIGSGLGSIRGEWGAGAAPACAPAVASAGVMAGITRSPRSGERSAGRNEKTAPIEPIQIAVCMSNAVASRPPASDPAGIMSTAMNFIVAFIRPCRCTGVIDCR